MLIRDEVWLKIREQFTEGEKAVLRANMTGETICPKGCTVSLADLGPNLRAKLETAITGAR